MALLPVPVALTPREAGVGRGWRQAAGSAETCPPDPPALCPARHGLPWPAPAATPGTWDPALLSARDSREDAHLPLPPPAGHQSPRARPGGPGPREAGSRRPAATTAPAARERRPPATRQQPPGQEQEPRPAGREGGSVRRCPRGTGGGRGAGGTHGQGKGPLCAWSSFASSHVRSGKAAARRRETARQLETSPLSQVSPGLRGLEVKGSSPGLARHWLVTLDESRWRLCSALPSPTSSPCSRWRVHSGVQCPAPP